MYKLEEIAKENKLDEKQALELIKVCHIYQKLEIKPGSFHEIKYKTYDFHYFVEEIKKGKTPLEIMNKVMDECEEYSRQQIFKKHQNNQTN